VRVLIGCEFSGIVREAFRNKGHDAWSCDLLPTEISGNHLQSNILRILDLKWDLAIFHPPCTYLAGSGLHWNKRIPGRAQLTEEAVQFVKTLMQAPIKRIALENPIGCLSTKYRKPDQILQPYQFGHPESKSTCLWLKDLPPLKPTNILSPPPAWIRCDCCDDFICTIHKMHVADCSCPEIDVWAVKDIDPYTTGGRWKNQTPSGQNKIGPSPDRWKERSRTYTGIAEAMAEQWDMNRVDGGNSV
jgi:hypothetical protein